MNNEKELTGFGLFFLITTSSEIEFTKNSNKQILKKKNNLKLKGFKK